MIHVIKSLEEMDEFASSCAARFERHAKKDAAAVVGLYGDLGAGKTAFVKALAKTYGIAEHITSPTFVIMKKYSIPQPRTSHFKLLIHLDAYRLEKGSELEHLGWNEIISNPQNLVCIEWPERVADVMPKDHSALKFTFIDETVREVVIQ